MRTVLHVLVSALAVFVTGRLLSGVAIDGFGTAIVVAIVLGLVNAVLGPALVALTLPLNVLTLGLFTFVAFVLAIVNSAFHALTAV